VSPNLIFLLLEATNPELSNALLAPPDAKHDDLEDLVFLNDDVGLVHQTGWDVLLMHLENFRVVTVLQGLILCKIMHNSMPQ
jgi:hypothetical protein